MTDIAQLGIQINSSTAPKAIKELDALTVSAGKAEGAAHRLGAATNQVTPAMAKGGHQSRMMAMQLSQVAQQASATGNFVQALAIQLPDMAMGFGAAGIAAGKAQAWVVVDRQLLRGHGYRAGAGNVARVFPDVACGLHGVWRFPTLHVRRTNATKKLRKFAERCAALRITRCTSATCAHSKPLK